ncbi:hypothetical protein Tco_1566537 [Tanacetum coccineum]
MLDYGFNFMNTKIYIDNESTICIIKNPVYHSKTKHIAIRHHFIRDAYEKKLIQVLKIQTDDNVADLLTKAFDVSSYLGFRESLERDIDGTEELLLPNLFIFWLIKVSTDSAKLIPLGKDSTAIKTLEKIPPRARLNADKILAEKLQEGEREMYTIEQRAKLLHDTIAAQRRFLAQQRSKAIRNKPPSRNQLRNQMMTYLKHVGGKKHSDLMTKNEKVIKEMNEQVYDASKKRVKKDDSIKGEIKEEE